VHVACTLCVLRRAAGLPPVWQRVWFLWFQMQQHTRCLLELCLGWLLLLRMYAC
jgi:hypothetical protein